MKTQSTMKTLLVEGYRRLMWDTAGNEKEATFLVVFCFVLKECCVKLLLYSTGALFEYLVCLAGSHRKPGLCFSTTNLSQTQVYRKYRTVQ